MKHAIDPTIDCVFKAILGSNEHINLLLNFLNSICKDDLHSPISDLTILNPYNEKQFLSDKLSIVDIKANDKAGNTFQIEIQMSVPQSLRYRMLHNWAELYSRQLTKGETWTVLKPVISIWLVCEPVFREFSGFHSQFTFRDQKNNLELAEHAKIHVIELSKWDKNQIENDLDIWAHFFKEGKTFSVDGLPDNMLTHEMEEAMAILKQFSEKERDYDRYMLRVEYLREQATLKEDREIALAELEKAKQEFEQVKEESEQVKKESEQVKKESDEAKRQSDEARKEAENQLRQAKIEIEALKSQLMQKRLKAE